MKSYKKIIKKLTALGYTIATMESCTGGGVANAITSVEGASEVLKFCAVTYSNEYKVKMGVDSKIIDTYSVYSIETARSMAKNISDFAKSTIGVGITGKLNKRDEKNHFGKDNEVFVSIYFQNHYYDLDILVSNKTRSQNKLVVIDKIREKLEEILLAEK